MNVAIVKYNAGNIYSVVNALKRLGIEPMLTDNAEELMKADRVLFPGQGEASGAMEYLKARRLDEVIRSLKQPVLGICVGMQVLCRDSEEAPGKPCLGVFDAHVRRFSPAPGCKVPHMGWNDLGNLEGKLFKDMKSGAYVYFVHSYYAGLCPDTVATCKYAGVMFSAALRYENFYGTQFHPEKSGSVGEQILKNFLAI